MGPALAAASAGGATGKFFCGLLCERVGIIRTVVVTEAAAGLGILLLLVLPLKPALLLLPVVGIALKSTSSVLYGTVPELVEPERRSRVYGPFHTIGIGAGVLAPPLFGILSDAAGVPATPAVLAAVIPCTFPSPASCVPLLRADTPGPAASSSARSGPGTLPPRRGRSTYLRKGSGVDDQLGWGTPAPEPFPR